MATEIQGRRASERLPDAVQKRVLAAGDAGRRWVDEIDQTITSLGERWKLRIGEVLPGGSASLVLAVRRVDGTEAILKLGIPGVEDFPGEMRAYQVAGGRGLATVYAQSHRHFALLIERLGSPLAELDWSVTAQIDAACVALKELWRTPVEDAELTINGGQKARWLSDFIDRTWRSLDRPCDRRTRDRALDFAAERADAHTPANCVLVHGDAHAHNVLTVLGSDNSPGAQCKLVDPDGLFAERACDLAVPMREWSGALRHAPVRLARERCAYLAELCEENERAIWQWGFMERVSSGLLLIDLGLDHEGREMLEIADHLAAVSAPG